MGTEPVIFEISSDEDEDWLSDLLDRVNEESDSFDDVVVVDEKVACAPAIQKHKFLPSNGMKGSGSGSDDDCLILDGDPDKPITAVDDTGNGTDDLLIVGEKGQKHSSFCPWRGVGCDTNEPLVAFKGSETQSNPQLTDCWNFVNIAGGLGLALSGRAEMALIDGSLPCGHPVNRTRRSS
ncbi:hypothetical protein MRB53_003812 [Persea americana]|uniref:Uncharacterized protein n=1 Tax=Persea americana TaxID=3435 RepID=A0ACC2N030_PERAE|nr:hypothetical protein MRB53_003812 [Persea americana]